MDRDRATLADIQRARLLLAEFSQGQTLTTFLKDTKTQSAILHQLLVVGETTKRLSASFRSEHPKIPWKLMAGMRDHLIHGYDAVDIEEVWHTTVRDVPGIVHFVQQTISPTNESDN